MNDIINGQADYLLSVCAENSAVMKKPSQFLKAARILMTICGMWRIDTENVSLKVIYNIFATVLHGNYYIFVVTTAIEATCILDNSLDFGAKSIYMTFLLFYIQVTWKMLLFQTKRIKKVIDNIHYIENAVLEGEDEAAKKIYKDYSRYSNSMFVLIAICNVTVFVSFVLEGISDMKSWKTTTSGNGTMDRSLKFPQWYPFDIEKHFEIAYLWQFVNALVPGVLHIVCDSMFLSLIIFPVLRLDILGYQFEHFDEYSKNTRTNPDKILRALILRHQEIIRSVDDLDDALRWYFFGDFLVRSYQISLLLFQIVTDEHFSEVVFFLSTLSIYLSEVFYMCFHANELILKSQDIGSRIFKSNWYEQPTSVKRTLFITMIRSTKPLALNIGNVDIMSNDILIKIIKAGYTYILVANR